MPTLKSFLVIAFSLLLCACGGSFNTPYASGHYDWSCTQCALYARDVSGIQLRGDANDWWRTAPPRYARGNLPQPGSVLVLASTPRMPHGHLAVVKNILNARQINVTQSNWGSSYNTRRIVYDSQLAEDVSPLNDWTRVRFWNHEYNVFGAPYAARGFIYNGNVTVSALPASP